MKRVFLLVVAIVSMLVSYAFNFQKDGIYYTITDDQSVAVVSKNGIAYEPFINVFEVTPGYGDYKGDIVIPDYVEHDGSKYAVTRIGYCAFMNCNQLTSVTLPSKVDYVCAGAFSGCTNLKSLNIQGKIRGIRGATFDGCDQLEELDLRNVTDYIDLSIPQSSILKKIFIPSTLVYLNMVAEGNVIDVILMDKEYYCPLFLYFEGFGRGSHLYIPDAPYIDTPWFFAGTNGNLSMQLQPASADILECYRSYSINDKVVTARRDSLTVYDLSGSIVAKIHPFSNHVLEPGVYIISSRGVANKVSIQTH